MTAAARRSRRLAPRLLGALTVVLLTACGGASPPAAKSGDTEAPYATLVVALETVPVERSLDGRVEAVEQGTIAAQTAGQVTALGFDVNDSVAAGALLVRLRGTEQRAGHLPRLVLQASGDDRRAGLGAVHVAAGDERT